LLRGQPSPLLCARSRFPDRGSALDTAAGQARPCALSPPAAGSPTRGVTARRRGGLQRERPSPLLCARSRFPDWGSALDTAAGRARPRALSPPAAGSPTRGVTARRRGGLQRERPSPLLCARSRFPDWGSVLGAAAGRVGPRALPRPIADHSTQGIARRRGCLLRERPSPLLCARSRIPDWGSVLGAAAGRAGPGAL